ncbi:hypothetical protein [Rhizobacter sp. Root1221]|uniref:hypothetical protein n=1 Tax=Rhizobacter sp. Root1221 TaxID=1736433 RepID=UPI000701BFA6|nr:hypothetical protein [Rhizobacter sp. Root1221]KQV94744.1 hypothetical protein ASC87_25885 [Rhizobacter sp. Root1221]
MPSRQLRGLIGALTLAASASAMAGPNWTAGTLVDMSAVPEGLLIRVDTSRPDNCAGTPFAWMLIPAERKIIIAATMMFWATGKRAVDVYTEPSGSSGAFCLVSQVDTHDA